MKKYKAIPSGKHRVLFMDYLSKNTLEIKGNKLNSNDLDIITNEIFKVKGWASTPEDIYWNDKHNCIEIEMGT